MRFDTGVKRTAAILALGMAVFAMSSYGFSVGLSDYTFVLPSADVSATDAFVVKDVNGLLARSLGSRLPVVSAEAAPKANRIFIRQAPAWFDYSRLSGSDAAVVIRDGDIWLFGRGANGVRYAAYDFLTSDLDYRFFDARGGVGVPDLSAIGLEDKERIVRFAFPGREHRLFCRRGKESALFYFRTGLNARMESTFVDADLPKGIVVDEFILPVPYAHGLVQYFPKNRMAARLAWTKPFARDYDKEMPECFALGNDGKRNPDHQPCLSNSEVRRVIRRNYFNMIARQDRPAYLDLSAGDTPGRFCWCEPCRALEDKYGTPGGPLLDLLLSFSPEVAARYPDQKMLMLAYRKRQTEFPPKTLARLPDNLVPNFAPIDDDFSKSWLHPVNANTLHNLREWGRLSKEMLVWYYPNPYGEPVTPPLGNVRRLATDMRLMKEAGKVSLFFEHNVGVREMTGFTELQTYLISRLSRDITLDASALIDEFLSFEYGVAAADVSAYLDELEVLTEDCAKFFRWDAGLREYDFLTPERLARWSESFDKMEKALAQERVRLRNVRRLRLGLDIAKAKKTGDVSVLPRIRAVLGEITDDCFAEKFRGSASAFVQKIERQLRPIEFRFGPNARPLPKELFGHVPGECVTEMLPIAGFGFGGMVDDPDAAYRVAAMLDSTKNAIAEKAVRLPFKASITTYIPKGSSKAIEGSGVTRESLGPRDSYKFYLMGRTTLTQDLMVTLGCWGIRSRDISDAYKYGAFNKARIYASLKFQGPAFYPDDTRTNKVFCDRIVVVRDYEGEIPYP